MSHDYFHINHGIIYMYSLIDVLNPRTIQSICKELIKKSTFSSLIKISKRLSASCFPAEESPNPLELDQFSKKHRNMDDVLFHSIYAWHCYNVAASKVTLAKKLIEWGYYNEAFVIEPSRKLYTLFALFACIFALKYFVFLMLGNVDVLMAHHCHGNCF